MFSRTTNYFSFLASLFLLLFSFSFLGACASGGFGTEDAANLSKTAGGQSESSAKTGDSNTPIALSQEGDAKNANVHASASRTVSTSAAGHVQTALSMAGNLGSGSNSLAQLIENDPVLTELKAELADLRANAGTTEQRTAVIAAMEARMTAIEKAAAKAGGDFSGLTHLTVVNIMKNTTGADEKPLTDAEAKAAAETLPLVIEKAKAGQAAEDSGQ